MAINQGVVTAPSLTSISDGQNPTILMGRQAEQIFAELHGKYYTQTLRGNLYVGSTPIAGVAIPISSSTAPTPCLWNPAGSGTNAVLVAYYLGYTGGTGVVGGLGYYAVTGAGNAIATGAPFSAFASTTPTNGLVGSGGSSKMKWSSTGTNTLTTAGTLVRGFGVGQSAVAAAGTSIWGLYVDYFDGTMIIPPGVAWYPAATAASVDTFVQSLIWYEAPI
jgi:hypothetical protein